MKKEVAPELYNYNKFPGPVFARVGDKVVAEDIELDLVLDYRSAFDQTVFGQRFTHWMLQYDYIVGDWGNEQLRLKGFYKDDKPVKTELKISRLEDYLLEYCNFGCAYFVLENPQPIDRPQEREDRPRRRRKRSDKRSEKKPAERAHAFTVKQEQGPGQSNHRPSNKGGNKNANRRSKQEKSTKQEKRANFVIRQK